MPRQKGLALPSGVQGIYLGSKFDTLASVSSMHSALLPPFQGAGSSFCQNCGVDYASFVDRGIGPCQRVGIEIDN